MFYTYRKVLVIAGIIFCLFSSLFAYSGGSGEPNDPYRIADANDLLALAGTPADYNKCFILTADIDLDPNLPGGQVFTTAIIAADTVAGNFSFDGTVFTGTFDGNGHKITNFTINGGNEYLGLFGYINGLVKNLCLENCAVSGYWITGGLAGRNVGSISNCYSTGTVSGGDTTGGLAGTNNGGNISNCYSTGSVSGYYGTAGGLVGSNENGNIINCHSTGAVSGTSNAFIIGGLAGYNNGGSISNCYSTSLVSSGFNSSYIGGLVGLNVVGSSISNCYSTGTVSATWDVGGLVGHNYDSSISNCYSTGTVNGSFYYTGGLAGSNYSGIISDCYATGTVSGNSYAGGLVGHNINSGSIINCYSTGLVSSPSPAGGLVGYKDSGSVVSSFWDVNTSGQTTSDGGEGKTTEEMQTLSTFASAGWDFSYTDGDAAEWFIQIDEYPILTWQISPADIYTDGKNDFRDFAVFAQYWMRKDCRVYNDYCEWSDLNFDGSVNVDDLIELMSYWLETGIY